MSQYDDAFEEADRGRRRTRNDDGDRTVHRDLERTRDNERPFSKPRHSGLGIASFVLAIVSAVIMTASFLILIAIGINRGPGIQPNDPQLAIFGLAMIGAGVLSLIGLALGLAGMFQSDRRPVFAIIGLIINVLILLGFCGVLGLGMTVAG